MDETAIPWDERDLPQSLRELVELVGVAAAWEVVKMYGGRTLPVLKGLAEEHPLVVAIGAQAVDRLARHYGSERPYLPRGDFALRHARNREIMAKYDTGKHTADDLAREYRVSNRTIFKILSQPASTWQPSRRRVDERQLMFDFGCEA